jgi:hypothetical protein
MATQIKINYKEYPEFMFAMISAYLPARKGYLIRILAGSVEFKSADSTGNTYKNGLLHNYYSGWFRNGLCHR